MLHVTLLASGTVHACVQWDKLHAGSLAPAQQQLIAVVLEVTDIKSANVPTAAYVLVELIAGHIGGILRPSLGSSTVIRWSACPFLALCM